MKVRALTHFDNFQAGQEFDLPKTYAEGVIKKGLAREIPGDGPKVEKAAEQHENKMAAEPANKSGRGRRASGNDE